jgi:hypothetical protein
VSDAIATTSPTGRQELHPVFDRIQWPALIAGAAATGLLIVGLLVESTRDQFFRSYLWAYLFWLGFPMGAGGLLMVQYLTGGAWGLAIRRLLESATRMIIPMAILFIPIAAGIPKLYVWAHQGHDELHGKEAYLNPTGWLIRAAICFALWIVGAFLLNLWSAAQDRTGNPAILRRLQLLSGPGLLVFFLTMTVATVDWVMSIDPHWYSTIYSLIFIVGFGLATLAMCIVLLALLSRRPPLSYVITRDHFHDLGNLLMASTMLWAYMSFSQFLIMWSGNIAEEAPYYTIRTDNFQKFVGLMLVIFHFAVPFALLLNRKNKRSVRNLAIIASLILVMRMVDLFWIVVPTFYQGNQVTGTPNVLPHWLDFVAPVAIGGIFIFLFIIQLRRRPLVPLHDHRLAEAEGGHH